MARISKLKSKVEIAPKGASIFPRYYLEAPKRGENRLERRRAESLTGRKNTRGYPSGYNARTWAAGASK